MNVSHRRPGRPPNPDLRRQRAEEILDAAARLFAQRGYAAANTQDLADALGVGKGTIYRYFPTKRDLFLAAVDRGMRRLTGAIDEAIEGVCDPLEVFQRAFEAYLAYFADRPELVELLIQERAQFKDRSKPTYFLHREANAARWHAMMRQLIAQRTVRELPVEQMSDVVGDLLYGTMFANYFAGRRRPPREQAREMLDVALCGVLSESGRQEWQSRTRRRGEASFPETKCGT